MFIKLLFAISALNAAVIKHDILNARYEEFSYKDVCEQLGVKHLELIEAVGETQIDCMGKVKNTMDFCKLKFPNDKTLTRAITINSDKKVKCEFSSSVMVSVSCDKTHAKLCLKPEEGCAELKKLYASELTTAHFSSLEKNLNCYFAKAI